MTPQKSDAADAGERRSPEHTPARSPLTREQQLVVGRILVSKPLPLRPKRLRFELVSAFGGLTVTVVLVVAWILWFVSGQRTSIAPFLVAATAINLVFAIAVAPLARRRAQAFIRLHQGFICPTCHYPLGSLPDEGQCPECATLYTRAQIVDMWKWSYRMKDRFPVQSVDHTRNATNPLI